MTNPTPSAEELSERMAALLGSTPWEKQPSVIAEQIRQAEQAARADERRKTLEEAAKMAATYFPSGFQTHCEAGKEIAEAFGAIAKSSEPGEAA